MIDHLERIDIREHMMQRWRGAATLLESLALMLELDGIVADPTRHNLERAARIARHIQRISEGDRAAIAHATATELEEIARG